MVINGCSVMRLSCAATKKIRKIARKPSKKSSASFILVTRTLYGRFKRSRYNSLFCLSPLRIRTRADGSHLFILGLFSNFISIIYKNNCDFSRKQKESRLIMLMVPNKHKVAVIRPALCLFIGIGISTLGWLP